MSKPSPLFSRGALLWLLRFAVLASATFLSLVVQVHAQRTLHVPSDFATIQVGIDAAQPNDTVLVAPGVYLENLNLRGKAITVMSAEGAAVTILDGGRIGPAVSMVRGETRSTILEGFTIRNGAPALMGHGAGVLLVSSSPTLRDNLLTGNLCAAIDATDSAPLVTGSTIRLTEVSTACGTQPLAPIVLSGHATDPTLISTLRKNIIEHNDLSPAGNAEAGAIALLDTPALVENNTLRFNTVAGSASSALALRDQPGTDISLIRQNLVYGNRSQCAAAISIDLFPQPNAPKALQVQIVHNTIADNPSSTGCPAGNTGELAFTADVEAEQVEIADNILGASSDHPALQCSEAFQAALFHHNMLHNTAGPFLAATCLDTGTSQFTDPLFTDRANSDYQLASHSPAMNAGVILATTPLRDLSDGPRLHDNQLDLGAYEHAEPKVLAASTTIVNTSASPAEAFQPITLTAQVTSAQTGMPSGTVTFSTSGQALATMELDTTGHASFTTTILTASTYSLTATYSGSETLAPSTAAPVAQAVDPATTILSFAVTPSSADSTQAIVLSAHVEAPLSTQMPTGQIQFLMLHPSGAPTVLATVALDAKGLVAATLPAMSAGTYRIAAAYLGTVNFAAVTLPASDALTLSVIERDYSLTLSSPALTVESQHHAPVTLTLTSLGSFAGNLTLSCQNLPPSASCTFTPATAALIAGGTATVTVMVETDTVPNFAGLLPITLLAFLPPARVRKARRKKGPILRALPLLVLCFLAELAGCTATYPAHTAAGTYQVQVTAQSPATSTTHSAVLTLTVTP